MHTCIKFAHKYVVIHGGCSWMRDLSSMNSLHVSHHIYEPRGEGVYYWKRLILIMAEHPTMEVLASAFDSCITMF